MPSAQDIGLFLQGLQQFAGGVGGQRGLLPQLEQNKREAQLRQTLQPFLDAVRGTAVHTGAGQQDVTVERPDIGQLPLASQLLGLAGGDIQTAVPLLAQALFSGQEPFTPPTETGAYRKSQLEQQRLAQQAAAQEAQAAENYQQAAKLQQQVQAVRKTGQDIITRYQKTKLQLKAANPNLADVELDQQAINAAFPSNLTSFQPLRQQAIQLIRAGNVDALGQLVTQLPAAERAPTAIYQQFLAPPATTIPAPQGPALGGQGQQGQTPTAPSAANQLIDLLKP